MHFTDPVTAALDRGDQPWMTTSPRPRRADGRPYPGAASVILRLAGRSSPFWLSAGMVTRVGGQIGAGEAPTAVPHRGGSVEVYCADQITGWTPPALPRHLDPARFIAATGARIMGSERPCYNTAHDFIGTPRPDCYAEIAHELIRWTAARLGRELPMATERLVCEIGAALLCADLAIAPLPRYDQAAFVPVWAARIRQKPQVFIDAAYAAGRAVDYLHGLQPARLSALFGRVIMLPVST